MRLWGIRSKNEFESNSKQICIKVDFANLPMNSSLKKIISYYHPNDRDQVQSAYLQKGPYQPINNKFSKRQFVKIMHWFNLAWLNEHATEYFLGNFLSIILFPTQKS